MWPMKISVFWNTMPYIYIYIHTHTHIYISTKVSEEPPASIFRIVQVFLQYILHGIISRMMDIFISTTEEHQILQKW
jgi:hypothetical protein